MQNKHGLKVRAQKAAGQETVSRSPLDDDANWRVAAELVEAMRNAGYHCELRVEQNLHS